MGDDSVRTINLQTGDIDMVDYVIRLLEKDEMLRAPDFVRNLSLVTVVICAAFSTLLSWILCDSMTRNIQRLNQGMDKVGDLQRVTAEAPLSEMFKYATDLRSMTQARGSFTMSFERYEEVPAADAKKIVEACKREEEDED